MHAAFRRVKEIFLAAVEVPDPAERDAYVREACGPDEALRRQVDALLGKHAQAGSFLESPHHGPVATVDDADREQSGTVIGPYKLLEEIGEGGMGTVWMAQQTEPVKRLVAVKLIKAGMDSRQVIARFEAERQALALMDHPNIARVLEGGTTAEGRPYFVMDLVKGVPITRYCDEHHLTPRQRLELFVPACQAVQHAHQKGIIHRDLKPSNVLVALYDGKPVPKVIDFGVAKAAGQSLTDKTLVTGFGAIVGTLEYMSPEQAEVNQLDIDTRSDIYSLGALLYELLAGSTPFSRKELTQVGMLEMLRVIREDEPSRPSTKLSTADGLPTLAANRGTEPAKLTKLVRGELDWIVMKALEKDRSRRYETANGFAQDIQRYLADEPVQACPPSSGYRLRKFVRRNQRPVLAAALLVVVLVAGIIGTTWGMFRATFAEADAVREADEKTVALGEKEAALATARANEMQAKAAQKDAQDNLKDALAAVDQLLTRVGEERLADVPYMQPVRKGLIEDALKFYQKFLKKQKGDPVLRRETAMARSRMANMHRELGKIEESVKSHDAAIAMLEELRAQTPGDPGLRSDLVAMHINAAAPLIDLGRYEVAIRHLRKALQLAEELVSEYPTDTTYGDLLVDAGNELAKYDLEGRPKEVERILRRNLTLPLAPDRLASTYEFLGGVLVSQRRHGEAEQAYRQAIAIREKDTAPADVEAPHWGWTLRLLADVIAADGREDEAEALYRRCLAGLDRQAINYSAGPHWRGMLAVAHVGHAQLLTKLKRLPEAETAQRRAIDVYEKLAKDFATMPGYWQSTFDQRVNLGQFLKAAGKTTEAIRVYQDASAIAPRLPTNDQGRLAHWVGLARAQDELGHVLSSAGKQPDADTAFRQVVVIQDQLEAEFANKKDCRHDLAQSHVTAADGFRSMERWAEAEKLYRRARDHYEKLTGDLPGTPEYPRQLANCHNLLGWALAELGRSPEAEQSYRQALELGEKQLAVSSGDVHWRKQQGHSHRFLAIRLGKTNRLSEAAEHFRAALQLFDVLHSDRPDDDESRRFLADTHRLLGGLLARRRQFPEAEKAYRRSIDIHEPGIARFRDQPIAAADEEHLRLSDAATSYCDLGNFLAATGQEREAERVWQTLADRIATRLSLLRVVGWYEYALLRSHLGQREKYQDACAQLLERFGPSANAADAYLIAWTSVLAPDAVADWTRPMQLAEKAHASDAKNPHRINLLGAVLYRAGRFKEAAQRLAEADEADEAFQAAPGTRSNVACNRFFQAMAQHRLGRTREAGDWLKKAVQAMDESKAASDLTMPWNRRLTLQLLRREAEELLKK
jgi:serine/threonine protein kinase/tetratricopeptide (TPR) repeat protein